MRRVKSVILAGIIALIFSIPMPANASTAIDMEMDVIDVGQGDSILIQSEGETLLVDAGKDTAADSVVSYLESKGIDTIDVAVATHMDEDHIGAMDEVFQAFDVKKAYYSPYTSDTVATREYMDAVIAEHCVKQGNLVDNETWKIGDATVEVITDGRGANNTNDSSIVLKVTCGGKSALLTGDISSSGMEQTLIDEGADLDCDVLKVAHHGSSSSTSNAFLNKATPDIAVISVGPNSYGHPDTSLMERLSNVAGLKTYRTDQAGTIKLNFNNGSISTNNIPTTPTEEIPKEIDISSSKVSGISKSYTYTGKAIKPEVKVAVNGKTLENKDTKTVYVSTTGTKYHFSSSCSNMKSPKAMSLSSAIAKQYGPCSKCVGSYSDSYKVSYYNNTVPGKATVKITGLGNYTGTITKNFNIVPKAPSSVSAKLYGHDDVKFSWSKSTGATGYAVYYKKSTSGNYTYLTRTTGTSIKKSGLTDGAKYYFKVIPYKTIDGVRTYGSSKYTSVYTLKQISKPPVYKYSSSKVRVKWTNISGESGYQISKSTRKTGTNIVCTYGTTSGTYKTISATKGKTYYYKVRAYKTVDGKRIYGPWSPVRIYRLR